MAEGSALNPSAVTFENPLALPLEKVFITITDCNYTTQQVKALDPFWADRHSFPGYSRIPADKTEDSIQLWLKRAHNYINALKYVYKLPFYKFWSYISYEPAVAACLDSFLTKAVSPVLQQPTGDFLTSYTKMYDLVFRIYLRISTLKESETEYISPQVVAFLLKDKVINNCVLWDLVRLYAHIDDDGLLGQIFKNIYDIIPTLKDELSVSVSIIADIFETIGTIAYENDAPTEKSVIGLTVLLHEAAFTVQRYLKVYPDFRATCIAENLFSRIVHTYGSECPIMYKMMKSVLIDDNHTAIDRVANARVELLQICQILTTYCIDMVLQTQSDLEEQHKWSEQYLGLILCAFDQTNFLTDFNVCFPIITDVETLQLICETVDKDRCNHIISTLKSAEEAQATPPAKVTTPEANGLDEATIPEDIILESKIAEILDMFPNLGDGFVEQCLLHMNLDAQLVIMAILEENLPPELSELDRSMPRIPAEETPEEELEKHTKLAYVGKKPVEHKNFAQLLDDKSHIQEQKERFTAYSLISDDMYDDDYDDSYDACPAIVVERDDLEKMSRGRLHGARKFDSEEDEVCVEEADEEGLVGPPPRGDAFCEDPAVLRARREAKYQQRQPPPKSRDVVGKAKGQGQDKSVLNNRENKNTHKSSRGNHNRRSGAQWKRGRGMIPS